MKLEQMKSLKEGSVFGTIYVTWDYSKFEHIKENRSLDEKNILKIIDKINKVGFLEVPIVVNEKMEVIDGQHRLEACIRCEIPVPYIISQGAGVEEIRALNTAQKNWTVTTYLNSYADGGNEDYIRLRNLFREESDEFLLETIYSAGKNNIVNNSVNRIVSEGKLKFTEENVQEAKKRLDFVRSFRPIFKRVGGNYRIYDRVLLWCYKDNAVDKVRLRKKLTDNSIKIRRASNSKDAFDEISAIYNIGIKEVKHIDLRRNMLIHLEQNVTGGVGLRKKIENMENRAKERNEK